VLCPIESIFEMSSSSSSDLHSSHSSVAKLTQEDSNCGWEERKQTKQNEMKAAARKKKQQQQRLNFKNAGSGSHGGRKNRGGKW